MHHLTDADVIRYLQQNARTFRRDHNTGKLLPLYRNAVLFIVAERTPPSPWHCWERVEWDRIWQYK